MVKKTVFVCIFALLCGLCFAQQVVVAVFPFEARSGTSPDDANTVTEVFNIKLQATGALRTVGRNVIDNVIKQEHIYQMSDFASDEKTAQLKKGLNADWVVYGVVTKLGRTFVITATLIDLNTNETMGGAPMQMDSIEEAFEKMDAPITAMIQRLTSGLKNVVNRASRSLINSLPHDKTVVVFSVDSQDPDMAQDVIDALEFQLVDSGKFRVLDRKTLDLLRREQNFQMSDNVDDKSKFHIGKILGAEIVITGAISENGTSQMLTLQAVDIVTGRVIAVTQGSF
ncbi:MAG: CsgG/HfaB family protein [Treponema sp.]|nr:CsgG/HfaB family protein [Treponema sp.]